MSESQESKLRQKALLLVGRKGWSSKAWRKVIKRFTQCIELDDSLAQLRGKVYHV
jgi:flavorubredoxin|tara:strand:- start:212 stop:376 length:165 start_codon:yes stop_codon:yes gene_type:complete